MVQRVVYLRIEPRTVVVGRDGDSSQLPFIVLRDWSSAIVNALFSVCDASVYVLSGLQLRTCSSTESLVRRPAYVENPHRRQC